MSTVVAQADIRTCTGCTLVSSRSLQSKGMAKLILKFCLALCVCGAVLYGIPATVPVPGLFRVGSGASFGPFVTSSEVTGLLGAPTNFTKNEPKSILDGPDSYGRIARKNVHQCFLDPV